MCIREMPDLEKRDEQVVRVENPEIQALIRRCLQSEAEDRPDMEEIIVELELITVLFSYMACKFATQKNALVSKRFFYWIFRL